VVDRARFSPGFGASLVGILAGFVGGGFLVAVVAWPFALVSATALATGVGSGEDFAKRLILVFVLLFAFQLLVSAWIAQQATSIIGDGAVPFGRTFAAVGLGTIATFAAAALLPDSARFPVLGYSWVGVFLAAWFLSSGTGTRRDG
jgi:uncharacterized membrane protein